MSFGIRLRDLRKEKNLSQAELGKLIGVAGTTISQYEAGLRFPDHITLTNICHYLDISSDYLLGISSYKNPPIMKHNKTITCSNLTEEQIETIRLMIKAFYSINKKNEKHEQE